jgi:cytochrome c
MHSLEFNKISGAVLVALLLTLVIAKLGGIVYHVDSPEEMSYIVELEPTGDGGGEAAPAVSFDQMLAMADPAGGEVISKKCMSCHIFVEGDETKKQGPNLWGIVGREVASHPGFEYSGALSGLGGTWTFERLNEFISGPRTYAPGTKMTFAGLSDMAARADLIAYLNTLSADPLPLPDVEETVGGTQVEGDDVGVMDSDAAASDATMEGIDDTATGTLDAAGNAVDDAVEAVKDAADDASDAMEGAADSVSGAVDDAADSASDAVDSVTGGESSDN